MMASDFLVIWPDNEARDLNSELVPQRLESNKLIGEILWQ